MRQVELDVIAPILGSFDQRSHCQLIQDSTGIGGQFSRASIESYPDVARHEFHALAKLLLDLRVRYGDSLLIRVIDPGSVHGLWRSTRHRVRSYPSFIVDGQAPISGIAPAQIDAAIRARLTARRELV